MHMMDGISSCEWKPKYTIEISKTKTTIQLVTLKLRCRFIRIIQSSRLKWLTLTGKERYTIILPCMPAFCHRPWPQSTMQGSSWNLSYFSPSSTAPPIRQSTSSGHRCDNHEEGHQRWELGQGVPSAGGSRRPGWGARMWCITWKPSEN
jgi:hypothetical protein